MKFAKRICKTAIWMVCIYWLISCFTPNVLSRIGKLQAFGLNHVKESRGDHPEWEWPGALDTSGSMSLCDKGEYLKEDIVDISLRFQHNSNDISICSGRYNQRKPQENDKETVETVHEENEQWNRRIYVTAEEMQGNILGYTLIRMPPNPANMYYERDMPYLLEKDMVGKGIYISDYVCETEVFLGNILKEVIRERGVVNSGCRQYFTEYALQQLEDEDWSLLDETWQADPYAYDRTYRISPVSGGGYQFYYLFFPEKDKGATERAHNVEITLYIDDHGKICGIQTDILTTATEETGMEKYINTEGLFDDTYCEHVILAGSPCKEPIVWDFERYFRKFISPAERYEQYNTGLLESACISDSAENLADIFLHVIADRGADAERYVKWFGDDNSYQAFADMDWESLEEGWTADEEYDCFFVDSIYDLGYAEFRYYFYPDLKVMNMDRAKMVMIDCNVSVVDGQIYYTKVDFVPITAKGITGTKQKLSGDRTLVINKGSAPAGKEKVAIPVIDRPVAHGLIERFAPEVMVTGHSERKECGELWGFTDTADVGEYLAEKLFRDFERDNIVEGETDRLAKDREGVHAALYAVDGFLNDGWKADRAYDCFLIKDNEVAGCLHLQYYFYSQTTDERQSRTLVMDVYLSEEGIEHMKINELHIRREA